MSLSEDPQITVPCIRISPAPDGGGNKRRRKQEHPHRSLKQLASVADKILHGIIIIEPFLPWERDLQLNRIRVRRKRSSGEESDSSLGSPVSINTRPTMTRSPAPMGVLLSGDTEELGVARRRELYESILVRRRGGPSRAGMPLDICAAPGASLLDTSEFEVCSTLRLYPLQYFQSRDTLVRNCHIRGFYKKSAAQKMLHIDVNKTGKLYDYFVSRGWMPISGRLEDMAIVSDPPQVNWHSIEPK